VSELEQAIERIVRRILDEREAVPANDASGYLSVSEAAAFARVSAYTIRRWVKRGELTRHEAGTRLLVRRDELEKLLAGDDAETSVEERVRRRFG
jgi:excisionase family DNA binding protein